jgi:SAM-dependent methyltransferase
VLCVNVLPHIQDLAGASRELARVLAPGGLLVIGTIHPVAQAGTLDEETGELRVRGYFTHEAHAVPLGEHHVFHQHRTIEDYLRTFLAAGLTLADIREVAGPTGAPLYLDLVLRPAG